jgi:hypothetical protein
MTLHEAVNYKMTSHKSQLVKPSDHVPIWTRVSLERMQRAQMRLPRLTAEWEPILEGTRTGEGFVKAIKVHKAMCGVSRGCTPRFKISNSVLLFLDAIVSRQASRQ